MCFSPKEPLGLKVVPHGSRDWHCLGFRLGRVFNTATCMSAVSIVQKSDAFKVFLLLRGRVGPMSVFCRRASIVSPVHLQVVYIDHRSDERLMRTSGSTECRGKQQLYCGIETWSLRPRFTVDCASVCRLLGLRARYQQHC